MSRVNLEDLMTLSAGDIVEVPSLTGPLSSEATLFQVEKTETNSVTFRVMFHGIRIAKVVLARTEKGIVWM